MEFHMKYLEVFKANEKRAENGQRVYYVGLDLYTLKFIKYIQTAQAYLVMSYNYTLSGVIFT